jgi:hypothetical protein
MDYSDVEANEEGKHETIYDEILEQYGYKCEIWKIIFGTFFSLVVNGF